MQEAYDHFREEKENISFGEWKSNMEERSPQFQFWSLTLKIELDYLLFLRSIRSRNFELYVLSIAKILPWLFALDHYHYARWLSIHLHDMQRLEQTDPQIHHEFCMKGNFVVSRRKKSFSSMGIDQRHEQLNKNLKGDGGMIGLTEDEEKLRRWMICTPETARAVYEFKSIISHNRNDHHCDFHHHEDSPSFQRRFHVNYLIAETLSWLTKVPHNLYKWDLEMSCPKVQ